VTRELTVRPEAEMEISKAQPQALDGTGVAGKAAVNALSYKNGGLPFLVRNVGNEPGIGGGRYFVVLRLSKIRMNS